MIGNPLEIVRDYDLSELNKKFGRIALIRASDSDINEGATWDWQLWFMEVESMKCYLLMEDGRKIGRVSE